MEWKKQPKRKPLIIKGVRQCGKTSSVLEFAHNNYEHVIYLNFHENDAYKAFFDGTNALLYSKFFSFFIILNLDSLIYRYTNMIKVLKAYFNLIF